MASFMFLFRGNPSGFQNMSPEQMQQVTKRWMDWRQNLEKGGHVKMLGQRLDMTGKVVRGKSKAITDGPYVEVKDFVQGYMVVEAAGTDEALEFAKSCPGLDMDGSVEIRPFYNM